MRFHLAAGLSALVLAGCSGGNDTAAPEPAQTVSAAATEAAAPAVAIAAPEAEAPTSAPEPTQAATPEPKPTPSPSPKPGLAPVAAAMPVAEPVKLADAAPPAVFARCAVCHEAAKGAPDKLGPNLYGVFGAKAAQGGFSFSDALKNSGLTFDEATLDKWIENPRALVPGNRMSFPGLKDPAKRQAIIDYLKQQR
ncbi:c-type cytochrome [Novosphingobium mathurense]|uniref:Cytochrome c n=1 Tax=Novosphingobium mathurense TaxID=428990 RepID=A0A1U6IHD4_9SPHN|nr:c-type cytochrome [Novosphingobium mathurense]SLK07410.1 cytochrome c [Novosphingobium mathurense]